MTNICNTGKFQSPINIKSSKVISCNALCDLIFYYKTSKCSIVSTGGNNVVMNYDTGSYVMYNTEVFELEKISFSTPSAHKIDNNSYPLEINIHHRSPNSGTILIIAVLCDVNNAVSNSNNFLDMIIKSLPKRGKKTMKEHNTPKEWNIFNAIPETKSFYLYNGSLPRTPCSENIKWIVFENTINCSEKFYNLLKPLVDNNIRSIQRLNGRKIYYNSNNSSKNNRNFGNKLRCYTEKQFHNACSNLHRDTDLIAAKNKQALLLTIVIILIVLMILLILYLIQEGFFEKIFKKLNIKIPALQLTKISIPYKKQ